MAQHHDVLGRVYRPEDAGLSAEMFDAAMQQAVDTAEQQRRDDPTLTDLAMAELARQQYYDAIGYGDEYRQARDTFREIAQQYGYEEEVQARMIYGSDMTADRYRKLHDSVTRDEENRLMMDFSERGFALSADDRAAYQRYEDRTIDREFPSAASGVAPQEAVGHRTSQPDPDIVEGERAQYRGHERNTKTLGQQLKELSNFQALQVMSQEIIRRVRHDVAEFTALYEQWRNPGGQREYPQQSAFGDFDPEIPSVQPTLEQQVAEQEESLHIAEQEPVEQSGLDQEQAMQYAPQGPKVSGVKAGKVVEGFGGGAKSTTGSRTISHGQSAGMAEHTGQPRKLTRQHRSMMSEQTQLAMDATSRQQRDDLADERFSQDTNASGSATAQQDHRENQAKRSPSSAQQSRSKPKDPQGPSMTNMEKFQIASKTVSGAVMGAKTGTMTGRAAGPWGTAIGGVAGAVAGGADGFKSGKSEFEKAQQRLRQSLEAHGHTPDDSDKDRGPAGPSL